MEGRSVEWGPLLALVPLLEGDTHHRGMGGEGGEGRGGEGRGRGGEKQNACAGMEANE